MKVKDVSKYTDEELKEIVLLSKLIPEDVKPIFPINEFIHLKYGQVIRLKSFMIDKQAVDEEIIIFIASLNDKKIDKRDIVNSRLKRYFRTINIIELNFKKIRDYEKLLDTDVDSKLVSSGIDRLNQFGDLNTIDILANGDILKWADVLELEWWDVFNKLYKTKVENDIRRDLEFQNKMNKER